MSLRNRIVELVITIVLVASGLQFAVHVIDSILPKLVFIGSVVGVVLLITFVIRYQRSRW